MAFAAWLVAIAVVLVSVPRTIAQNGCTVTVRLPATEGGQASINMAIINTGSMYPAGSQSFTLENPTYTRAVSTNGWTSTGASNGVISGVVQLAQPLAASGALTLSAVVAGSSPQNFFPRAITFGGRACHIQQMR